MDSFINLAKQGIEAYESHSSSNKHGNNNNNNNNSGRYDDDNNNNNGGRYDDDNNGGYGGGGSVSKTGGHEYNSPHHSGQQHGGPDFDEDDVVNRAQNHGSGDRSLFSSAMGFINNNKSKHEEPVDEDEVIRAHEKAYKHGDASNLSAGSMGSAAALQILQKFTSSGSSGSGSKTELISMAMAEASKLFDKSGGAAQGNKQDAVNGAAMTVMKLLVQSKFNGGTIGKDSGSGGFGQLMGLASKFI